MHQTAAALSTRVQQLKLTSLDSAGTATVRSRMVQLPQRFPACSSVTIELGEQSYPTAPIIIDILSRLPALNNLTVNVTVGDQPLALAVVFSSISSRLPLLRNLTLVCADSWRREGVHRVWEQLGSITQVTSLEVLFRGADGAAGGPDNPNSCWMHQLAPLRGLTGLQRLCMDSCTRQQQEAGQGPLGSGFQFLEALTALTSLDIPTPSCQGLASISSCTSLQALRLRALPGQISSSSHGARLSNTYWEVVGQLERLTELRLRRSHQPRTLTVEGQQPMYAALSKLTALQSVGYVVWTTGALPALAALPELRSVQGLWVPMGDADGARCEKVTRLEHNTHRRSMVEFSAFPKLEVYYPTACSVDAQFWESMATFCPNLREVCGPVEPTTGLLDFRKDSWDLRMTSTFDSTSAERLSAIRSLSQLTALTRLSFRSSHHLEVATLAEAVPSVRELHLVALQPVSCMSLAPLAKLCALTSLCLYLQDCSALQHQHDLPVLLSALSRVPKVVVAGLGESSALERVVQGAWNVGLLLPADLSVVCFATRSVGF